MSNTTILYGIPNCDTVKKARNWLTEQGIAYTFHDFKKQGVPADHLPRWLAAVGWDKLVNRQGTTWRKLDAAVQGGITDDASATALMLDNASVIKRPVVEWADGRTTIGFKADDWAAALSR